MKVGPLSAPPEGDASESTPLPSTLASTVAETWTLATWPFRGRAAEPDGGRVVSSCVGAGGRCVTRRLDPSTTTTEASGCQGVRAAAR